MHARQTRSFAFTLIVSAGTLLSTAGADEGCSVYRVGVPDLDQVRRAQFPVSGLDGNGVSHCAPTSASNFIMYMDRMGFPDFVGGANGDWYSPGTYQQATYTIMFMAAFMQTTPEDGTTTYWYSGLTDYLEAYYPDEFEVGYWNNAAGGPTPGGMYDLMTDGSLLTFCYGRYQVFPAGNGLPARRVRQGGHVVSLTSVINGCSGSPVIGYRDPASGGDSDTNQSAFTTAYWPIRPWTTNWAGDEDNVPVFRTNYILDGDFDDGRLRAIDGMLKIRPIEGLSIDATQGILSAKKFADLNLGLTNGVHPTHLLLPAVQRVREAAARHHPHLPHAVVILRGDEGGADRPGIWRCNLARGEWDRLADLPDTDAACFGPDGRYFVSRAGHVEGLDLASGGRPIECQTREHVLLACGTNEPGADRNPRDYQLVMITRGTAGGVNVAVGDVTGDGCSPFDPRPLPINFPDGCDIAVHPTDGTFVLAGPGIPGLVRFRRGSAGEWLVMETITPPGCGQPTSPQFDNKGRLIFCCDGVVNVIEKSSSGAWVPKTDSRWHGYQGGRFFELSRGRHGLSDWEGTPGDFNVDAEEEARLAGGRSAPDCPADFNHDGFVDFFDYDDFVSCFEGGPQGCPPNNPPSLVLDINEDGFVDFFDYDAFVGAFERGC